MSCEVPDGGDASLDARDWNSAQLRAQWWRFREQRDPIERELLLEAYQYLTAEVLETVLRDSAADPALAGLGPRAVAGLEDAVDRFPDSGDPSRFEEFAIARVRLAIEEGLQRIDWMPRTLRRRDVPSQPHPTVEHETSKDLGLDRILSAAAERSRAARKGACGSGGPIDPSRAPYIALAHVLGLPLDTAEGVGRRPDEAVRHALRRLPEQHRTVLTLQFLAGLTIEQVGALLGSTTIAAHRSSEHSLAALRRAIEDDNGGSLAAVAG